MNILYSTDEKFIKINHFIQWGKYIKAKRLLEEILEEEPGHARAHYETGMIYFNELINYEMAEYHFKLAMQFCPEEVFAYYAYQKLLFQQSRYEELVAFSEKALTVHSIYKALIYKIMAACHEEQHKFKKAIKYYEKAMLHALNDHEFELCKKMIERVKTKQNRKTKESVK